MLPTVRGLFASLAACVLVAGTAVPALAGTAPPYETRADFIYRLDTAIGLQPVSPFFPDFADVPPSSPYYGYIEAAYMDGLIQGESPGVFGPSAPITRAQAAKVLVTAYGAAAAAQDITSTTFLDNAQIPKDLVGYVGEAQKLGLMRGESDGTFRPLQNLTPTDEKALLDQFKTALKNLKLTLIPSASDVAKGTKVEFSVTGAPPGAAGTLAVVGADASYAIISGRTFIASQPGVYVVQATVGGSTAEATVRVYGGPVGLRIAAPTDIVANGVLEKQVTVSVVDQNGTVVSDNTDALKLYTDTNNAACVVLPGSTCAKAGSGFGVEAVAEKGVATFTIQSGTLVGSVANLSAEDITTTTLAGAQAQVATDAQKPTSVKVTAETPYLAANATGQTATFDAQLLDQTGAPMVTGTYPIFGTLQGPATFSDGGTGREGFLFLGNGQAGTAAAVSKIDVHDVQAGTGTVTLTVGGQGLTSGSATVTAVISGPAAQIVLSDAQSVDSDHQASYTARVVDTNGYPTTWTGQIDLTASDPGVVLTPATLTFNSQSEATFTAADTTAGSYTVTAADQGAQLKSATVGLTVTAGQPVGATITPVTPTGLTFAYVPLSDPTWSETVQLVDDHQNPVSEAGVEVDFTLNGSGANFGVGTLDGVQETTPGAPVPLALVTDTNGQATANVSVLPYNQETYQVDASVPALGTNLTGAHVETLDLVADGTIQPTYADAGGNQVTTLIADGTAYTGTFVLKDKNGVGVYTHDAVTVTPSGTGTVNLSTGSAGTVTQNSDGSWTIDTALLSSGFYGAIFKVTGGTAGPVTLTYQDAAQLHGPASPSQLLVGAGQAAQRVGFSVNGTTVDAQNPIRIAGQGSVAVTITSEDLQGNRNVNIGPILVRLNAEGGPVGLFRETLDGVSLKTVEMAPGASQTGVVYLNSSNTSEAVDFENSQILVAHVPAPVAAGGTRTVSFTAVTADGTPLSVAGASVTLEAGSPGTVTPLTSGPDGAITTTFTAPAAGWNATKSATVVLTVPGVGSVKTVVRGE